jgi:hypothetical protein
MNYERTIFAALGLLLRLELAAAGLYSYTLESDLTLCALHCVQLMSQVHQAPSQPEGGPHHRQDAGVDERGLPLSVLSFQANLTSSNRLCGGAMVEWRCCRSWAIYGLPRLLYGCRPRLLTTSSWVSYWFPLLTVAKPSTLSDPLRPTLHSHHSTKKVLPASVLVKHGSTGHVRSPFPLQGLLCSGSVF